LTSTRDAIGHGRRRLQETVLDRDREQRHTTAEEAAREAGRAQPGSVFFDQEQFDVDGPP